jgi:hypothetical protein
MDSFISNAIAYFFAPTEDEIPAPINADGGGSGSVGCTVA